MYPTPLTCLKLALFLILSGSAGASVGGGGGIRHRFTPSECCGVCREVVLPLIGGTGGKGLFFRAMEMDAPAALGNVWETGPVKHVKMQQKNNIEEAYTAHIF